MSAPIRFLSVVVIGWAVMRAGTLGALPGFTVSHAKPLSPRPVVATDLGAIASSMPSEMPAWEMAPPAHAYGPAALQLQPVRVPIPYHVPAYMAAPPATAPYLPPRAAWSLSQDGGALALSAADWPEYSPLPPLGQAGSPPNQSTPAAAGGKQPLDRWQMSSWALLRGAPSPGALAAGGTLGGSQAGARVTYALNRSLALSLRTTSPIGGSQGAEVAGGIRWAPLRAIPVAITAERRQSISPHGGGRSDFALFLEGGLYRRPLPWQFELDAYAQAGVVGLQRRDMFADGALAFTRPVYGRFSAGVGLWGGYQTGIYRLDAGPRVSIRVRDNIRAHVDWRQRLAGQALPNSGPALTLAADF